MFQLTNLMLHLLEYFAVLLELCDEVNNVQAPTIANSAAMQQRWSTALTDAMQPLVVAYTSLLVPSQQVSATII